MSGIVVVIGRMQGLTKGHGLIIDKAMTVSRMNGYQLALLLSIKEDQKKNPLALSQKISLLELAYGKPGRLHVSDSFIQGEDGITNRRICFHYHSHKNTPFSVIELDRNTMDKIKHISEAYTDVIVVVGGDQYVQFSKLFEKYKDDYPYPIKVLNAGERCDTDPDNVSSFSASKLRQAALDGNFQTFKKISLEIGDLTARIQYNRIRKTMCEHITKGYRADANTRTQTPEIEGVK